MRRATTHLNSGRFWRGFIGVLLLLDSGLEAGRAATFTVTNTADSGAGSLRQAMLSANTNPGLDTIVFQISGTAPFTLTPASALPSLTNATVLDGTTQLGYTNRPVIELSGTATTSGTIGLRCVTGASTVRGLAINRFPGPLIQLDSPSNVIQGNLLGTDVTGTLARGGGTGSHGVLVKSAGNLIGGTNVGEGNLISGGNDTGIYLFNASNNLVQGNFIGLAWGGTSTLSNVNNGVLIFGSSNNQIGGSTTNARNILSANGASGIYVTNGSNNRLTGNLLGTDVTGKIGLGNRVYGVAVAGAGSNQIGGTNSGEGNVISGNLFDGILLTGGTGNNVIQGNFIGVASTGTNKLANGQNGLQLSGTKTNLIGGLTSSARNLISGNTLNGISIVTLTDTGNTVQGNYIGTDATGAKALANTLAGVRLQASSNLIGGDVSGARNVISGNTQQGIWLVGTSGDVTGNVIQGNVIGLTAAGTAKLANGNAGVGISTAAGNRVGGASAAARNVISGNGDAAIFIVGTSATGNVVEGNYLGTDVTGIAGLGNSYEGIYLDQAATNFIGGTNPGAGNLISGNTTQGIYLTNTAANVIQGNFLGTKADGVNPLQNKFHNIELEKNANRNVIGGSSPGAGNRLAYAPTVYCGVRVRSSATNNLISGNAIFGNGGLGIDLSATDGSGGAGVNPLVACESGVAATAANRGQNFPTLTNAWSGSGTRVQGLVNGQAGKSYTLQFFASATLDTSGYGEGENYLGQTNVTLGATCSTNFTALLPGSVTAGWVITATATDANNNTSEFSAGVTNAAVPNLIATRAGSQQLTVAWTNSGGNFSLLQTFNLTPPILWAAVTNAVGLSNNFQRTTVPTTGSNTFYRLSLP